MIKRAALAVKAAGSRSWWETGKLWEHLKMRRVALGANVAVIGSLLSAGLWVYRGQERSIAKLRRTNESLSEQIAKKGSERKNRPERPHRHAAAVAEESSASSSR